MNAYRAGPTGDNKDWAKDMISKKDAIFPTAVFDDGTTMECTAISCEELRILKKNTKTVSPNLVWTGTHQECDVKVSVKRDHSLLVVMHRFEPRAKMICMVSVKAFGDEGEECVEKAKALMIDLGKKFVAGELAVEDLYGARDALMKQHKVPT